MYVLIKNMKIYCISFFSSFILFYAPIIFLYYKNYNVSLFQIGLIFSTTSLTTIIAEIPFGLFSDKKSPKLSVLIGSFFTLLGMLFLIFANNFNLFIVSAILIAIGDAGISGANSVLLMTLLEDKDEVFHISTITKSLANILGGLLIGIIFDYNIKLPFIISFILIIINIFLYSTISYRKEIKVEKERKTFNDKISFSKTIKNNLFILIILFFTYISIPQIMIYFPEFLSENNFSSKSIGIMYMLANLISLIGTKFHQIYMKKIDIFIKLKFSLFFIFICSISMWYTKSIYIFLFFYSIFRIITGWFFQLFSIYINNRTSNEYKSTLFSIASVVREAAFIISDPIVTFIISKNNIKVSYIFTALFTLLILTLIYIVEKLYRNKNLSGS